MSAIVARSKYFIILSSNSTLLKTTNMEMHPIGFDRTECVWPNYISKILLPCVPSIPVNNWRIFTLDKYTSNTSNLQHWQQVCL